MTIADWIRNYLTRFLWPCIAMNIEHTIARVTAKQCNEFQQELRAFMIEHREHMREVDPLSVRQVEALEKLAAKWGV